MTEILRSSIKDHGATVSLSGLLRKYGNLWKANQTQDRCLHVASQKEKFEKTDIFKKSDYEFIYTAEIQTNQHTQACLDMLLVASREILKILS